MSFAEATERQQSAIFGRLGGDATWSGVAGTVRVRHTDRDVVEEYGRGAGSIQRANTIRVRRTEVANPVETDQVELRPLGVDGPPPWAAARRFQVIGTPMLDRKGVWTCEVAELAG